MKVMFPGEAEMEDEGINDISGIVQEMSNIEDTSFAITIDAFNNKLGGKGKQPEKSKCGQTDSVELFWAKILGHTNDVGSQTTLFSYLFGIFKVRALKF